MHKKAGRVGAAVAVLASAVFAAGATVDYYAKMDNHPNKQLRRHLADCAWWFVGRAHAALTGPLVPGG